MVAAGSKSLLAAMNDIESLKGGAKQKEVSSDRYSVLLRLFSLLILQASFCCSECERRCISGRPMLGAIRDFRFWELMNFQNGGQK